MQLGASSYHIAVLWDGDTSKVCSHTTYKLYPVETEYLKHTEKEAFLQR